MITLESAYKQIKEYFSRDGAKLARTTNPSAWPTCRYRMEDGSKCAVGCLIPDELYDSSFDDGELFPEMIMRKVWPEIDNELVQKLRSIQVMHDRAFSVDDFLMKLNDFALVNGVSV